MNNSSGVASRIPSRQFAHEQGLVTVQEAAQLLTVSVSTLYGWVWQRRIPFIKVGRALRFAKADLKAFIERNRFEAER
jgi:excisionase family DNA binding protein